MSQGPTFAPLPGPSPFEDFSPRNCLESLGAACLVLDPAGRVRYGNAAWGALVGEPPTRLVGLSLADDLFPAGRCFLLPAFPDALAGRAVRSSQSWRGRQLDCSLQPIRDAHGAVVGVVALAHDVTELYQALLQQKRESLGLFAAGLAHDLNNLLVGMLTAADLLVRDLPDDSEQKPLAALIKKAAERSAQMTRQMLLYAGKVRPARRRIDLNTFLEEHVSLFSAALPASASLARSLAPALPVIDADPGLLLQAVTNLLTNAAEALGPAGGQVTLRTATAGPADVILEVSDTGCGMEPAVAARVFDPFFSTKGRGRGLGLASVQGIAQAHGGQVAVDSAPGRGSTFRIHWPAATATTGVEKTEAGPASPPSAVLVVDDEPVVRGVVARALAHLQLHVLTAGDGVEGLDLFRQYQGTVRLVLLDVGLSSRDGVLMLTELLGDHPEVQVVLTSGSETQVPAALAGRPVAFLPKPYTVHALLDVVRAALARGADR